MTLTSTTAKRTDTVEVSAGAFDDVTIPSAAALTLEGPERKNLASVLADDPLRAVQTLPGVTSNNDFDSEFSLRGASFDRIGLYLDGILLHAPFHTTDGQSGDGSLTIFNGDMTGVMTLYEGAWPVRYSDRTAGILAVETREGNREGVHGRVTASLSNAGVVLEGPLGKNQRGSYLLAFRKSYLQYILNRILFQADSGAPRVTVDVGGYRAQAEEVLVKKAREAAEKVRRWGDVVELEPMNSFERRIIHHALKDDPGVETYSVEVEGTAKKAVLLRPKR